MREQLLRDNIRYITDVKKVMGRGDLAKSMDVTVQALGQLIRGDTKTLKPINLVKAAKRIGVTVESLVCDDLRKVEIGATAPASESSQPKPKRELKSKINPAAVREITEAHHRLVWIATNMAGVLSEKQAAVVHQLIVVMLGEAYTGEMEPTLQDAHRDLVRVARAVADTRG